jgi:hypothetical protein
VQAPYYETSHVHRAVLALEQAVIRIAPHQPCTPTSMVSNRIDPSHLQFLLLLLLLLHWTKLLKQEVQHLITTTTTTLTLTTTLTTTTLLALELLKVLTSLCVDHTPTTSKRPKRGPRSNSNEAVSNRSHRAKSTTRHARSDSSCMQCYRSAQQCEAAFGHAGLAPLVERRAIPAARSPIQHRASPMRRTMWWQRPDAMPCCSGRQRRWGRRCCREEAIAQPHSRALQHTAVGCNGGCLVDVHWHCDPAATRESMCRFESLRDGEQCAPTGLWHRSWRRDSVARVPQVVVDRSWHRSVVCGLDGRVG